MDTLIAAYRDDTDDDINDSAAATPPPPATTSTDTLKLPETTHTKDEPKTPAVEELSTDEIETSVYGTPQVEDGEEEEFEEQDVEVEVVGEDRPPSEKENELSEVSPKSHENTELPSPAEPIATPLLQNGDPPPTFTAAAKTGKKPKKKSKDVWTTTTRKGKKKTKHASSSNQNNVDALKENQVLVTPMVRFPDKNDDSPDLKICLSKVYKAEKVELSEDRLTAGSVKGYRMVRATRGVSEGAWYFEIKVVFLGETGHTRLGWSMEKADLQAPVGYDENSFAYRDIDGSKVHKALREKYGDEGYKEGDVLGFYINLPDGESYAPDPPRLVWHKSQRYLCAPEAKDDGPKNVPGSEITYFKNGICQGTAFRDICGGHYYPAASMYTLPNNPSCVVKFNFGPDFERFPEDFGERPIPRPMIEVPYQSYDDRVENGIPWNVTRTYPMLNVVKEEGLKILKDDEIMD